MSDQTREQTGPLRGMRVLELGHFIAAPFCTRVLADMGAEVIKVEPPGGDPVRSWGMQADGASLWWSVHGRNKKCVTLNLKEPKARDIALRLVAGCDAMVENFRPGLLEKFGLGEAALGAARPGLVLARVSGFGQTGPRRNDASFGMIGEAIGGIRHLTGYPKEESDLPPVRTGVSLGDSVAGLYAAIGVLGALWERGHAPADAPVRVVDVALTESVMSLLEGILPEYGLFGSVRQPTGSRIMTAVPSNAYATLDGAWVLIGANSPPLFERLMGVIGKPELIADPRFVSNAMRIENVEAMDAEISAWTSARTAQQALADLAEAGVPSSKIYDAADIVADEQYRARGAVRMVDDPLFEKPLPHPGPTPRFANGPDGGIFWPGPEIGAHNDEVYGEMLGMDAGQREDLAREGVI